MANIVFIKDYIKHRNQRKGCLIPPNSNAAILFGSKEEYLGVVIGILIFERTDPIIKGIPYTLVI